MAILKSEKVEKDAVEVGASMMALTARTAPKGRGVDSVKTLILTGQDLEQLAVTMEKKVKEKSIELPFFKRDADNVRNSAAVLLIGVSRDPKRIDLPLNCGACGYKSCKDLLASGKREGEDFTGPLCVFQAMDLGIALGSAVKLAGELNIDNRIMYTVGAAAKKLGLLDSDVIIGIPLSVTGKNPYFDRPQQSGLWVLAGAEEMGRTQEARPEMRTKLQGKNGMCPHFKCVFILVSLCFTLFGVSCAKEHISFEERDKILDKAFADIESSDESTVINGLETIRRFPTQKGLNKLIQLWEKTISERVEKEILDTLRKDEIFENDSSFIEDIFNKYYKVTSSRENKLKLRRLLQRTDVQIKKKLIARIDKDLKTKRGSP